MFGLVDQEINEATLRIMEGHHSYIDSETFNLIFEKQIPSLSMCLWGNIVKNPRLKDFSFKLNKFTLELPKPMLLADVAVRVLYLHYDTLTPQCSTYLPAITESNTTTTTNDEDNGNITDNADGILPVAIEQDNGKETLCNSRANSARINSAQSNENVGKSTDDKGEIKDSVEGNSDSVAATNDVVDDPDQLKEEGSNEDEVDMRAFTIAGGPIILELLILPSLSKVVSNWTIKPATMTRVQHASDPVDASGVVPPIPITMSLPSKYLFSDEVDSLNMAQWDDVNKMWRSSDVANVKFDLCKCHNQSTCINYHN
jgi:cancer susceptibility candidate protein 1